ncbi:glycosyl hydrolase [Leptodontidium sp. 2 PMI_412]|nr:glycosyl hydrolase [Leptodontidium sp. 2 PMI_412]
MSTINPIIPGFASDPSTVRIGDVYFIVSSSFHLFPGLPIYASKDLVSWKRIVNYVSLLLSNAINRRAQLSLRRSNVEIWPSSETELKMQVSGGLYGPTISVRKDAVFVTSSVPGSNSTENFIVATKDIRSDQWSDPVYFDFYWIDPRIFVDEDGAFIFKREIWTGTGGIHPEGPHVYKKDGWYYLLVAEGGTLEGHMMTVARSKDIWGPYESNPSNPILTASGDDGYIQHTGHCDLFQSDNGEWWGVCLGLRKDTFLTSGSWLEGKWLSLGHVELNPKTLPQITSSGLDIVPASLLAEFVHIRDAELDKYKANLIDLSKVSGPHIHWEAPASDRREKRGGKTEHIKAGLVCYKDEQRFFRISYDTSEAAVVFEVWNNADKIHRTALHKLDTAPAYSLNFRIEYTEKEYRASYRDGKCFGTDAKWHLVGSLDTLELTNLDQ